MGKSMTETDYLNPTDIQSQCSSATSIIEDNNTSLTVAKSALAGFVSSGKQEGAAVDSLRLLISDFYTVADSVSVANGLTTADFNKLSSDVGSEELDGSIIIPGMKEALESKEEYESLAQAYYDEIAHPSSFWTWFAIGDLTNAAISCGSMAESYENKYNEYKRQKEAWEDIESSTSSLFSDSAGIRGLIADAIANMNGCYENGVYAPDMNADWRTKMADAQEQTARTALLHSGVTQKQIDYMCNDLNYTAVELLNDWSLCLTDTDKEFFLHLMDGEDGYADAFKIYPEELSDSMALVLGNYSSHLLVFDENGKLVDGEERFKTFNNAVLASTSNKIDANGEEITYGTPKYLEMLMAGSLILLQGDATVLAAYGPNAAGLENMYSRYYSRLMSADIWSSEQAAWEISGSSSSQKRLKAIDNLSIEDIYNYSFDMTQTDWKNEPIEPLKVVGGSVTDITSKGVAVDLQELIEIRKSQEKAVQETLVNMALDLTIAGLAVYCPPAAIGLSAVKMGTSGKASNPSGLSHYTDEWIKNYTIAHSMTEINAQNYTNMAKAGTSGVTSVIVDGVNLLLNLQKLDQQMLEAEEKDYYKYFGMMNTADIFSGEKKEVKITYGGLYDPNSLYLMGEWESRGCGFFVDFKDGWDTETVLEDIKGQVGSDSEEYEYAKKMLTGEGELFSEDMDMEMVMRVDDLINNHTEDGKSVFSFFGEERAKLQKGTT
ncbi:MAG: hypothetical protein E7236_03825 [Lachnospiraceae bacterium]|nr:hypothetical protein [Lachnospiraceae bacterium]